MIKLLKVEERLGMRILIAPKTLSQNLHISLIAVATVHIGNSTE
jgi:hypothetical protein